MDINRLPLGNLHLRSDPMRGKFHTIKAKNEQRYKTNLQATLAGGFLKKYSLVSSAMEGSEQEAELYNFIHDQYKAFLNGGSPSKENLAAFESQLLNKL